MPAFHGQVRRGAARLNLRMIREPVFVGDIRERESLLPASIAVDSVAGAAFHQTLKLQPWGARNFIVRDPDGNLLLFAGPASS